MNACTMFSPVSPDNIQSSAELRDALLTLNNDHATELSWLDEAGLMALVGSAFYAKQIGIGDALLLAFDQTANYDSPNFLWFRERNSSFVYVDRVVTGVRTRGRGLARALYLDLFEQALAAGHERIVCEVNSDPPNPASEAFHQKFGFREVGSASLRNGKTVTYLELRLRSGSQAAASLRSG